MKQNNNKEIVVRDMRKRSHFSVDDLFVDEYARVCGPYAVCVYMCLCRHANFKTQESFPSIKVIANKTRISEDSANRGLKTLISYGIITKERSRHPNTGRWVSNSYVLIDKSKWKHLEEAPSRHERYGAIPLSAGHHTAVSGFYHTAVSGTKDSNNSKDSKEKVTKESAQGAEGVSFMQSIKPKKNGKRNYDPLISGVISAFEEVDPKNKTFHGRASQRAAAQFLVKEYGYQTVLNRIGALKKTNEIPFFPTITSPVQLKDKWVALENAVIRSQNEKNQKVKIV